MPKLGEARRGPTTPEYFSYLTNGEKEPFRLAITKTFSTPGAAKDQALIIAGKLSISAFFASSVLDWPDHTPLPLVHSRNSSAFVMERSALRGPAAPSAYSVGCGWGGVTQKLKEHAMRTSHVITKS